MKFVSVQEMISIEHEADRAGLSYSMMMENAGLGLAKVIHERYQLLLLARTWRDHDQKVIH
jgi:NAD(P)H-hydrate repair Nnr-like enzyme with NAD(P)H-hydrate epimerase domain